TTTQPTPALPTTSPIRAFPLANLTDTPDTTQPTDRPAWLDTPPPTPAQATPPAPIAGGLARRQPPDGEARRTPSGLVKRSPRVVDTGEIKAVGPGPDDDLLASLSRYTTGLNPAVDRSAPQPPAPQQLPHQPPAPQQLPARHAASPQPPHTSPAPPPPRRQGGATLGGLAAGLSGLSPFSGPPSSSPPPMPAGHGQAPANRGTTPTGLTRRVRGAQMPTASPLAIRRSAQTPDPGAAPPAQGPPPAAPPARTPEQKQSADAVYSFLSSFTAGVQRGLDDARSRRPGG
ncbi:MAG TPA: hypothetical protein VFZ79_19015, partial [Acidimicrobiales bacterium]